MKSITNELYRETLDEYMASYEEQEAKIERYDKRIEEIAEQTKYHDKVKKLECFLGIKTHTALSLIVETGDFERFAKGNQYASYLGLAPGENSSSDSIHRLGITKAGNSHLRQLLIEASGGICKGAVGHKSKDLRARQNGNTAEVGMNYNLPKSEDSRQPQCPMEKEKAIRDALEHFGMI